MPPLLRVLLSALLPAFIVGALPAYLIPSPAIGASVATLTMMFIVWLRRGDWRG